VEGPAPPNAQVLAEVHSQPMSILLSQALLNSDNVLAEALARQALAPMFAAGGRVIDLDVDGNPVRETTVGRYQALETTATKSRNGDVFLLVVNRLPRAREAVRARIELPGLRSADRARVWHVSGPSFQSANLPGQPAQVSLSRSTRGVGRDGFAATFEPHSITVFRLPWAR